VADRSLVLDANILLRAVLGKRVGELIERYAAKVDLFAPDSAFDEVEEHLAPLAGKTGMPVERAIAVYDRLGRLVQELPHPMYGEYEAAARARIERVDADDWPVIACALALESPIWTEDRDFFGAGVPTWTTDRVELYLANAEPPRPGTGSSGKSGESK
jgi:predicted nucleic acid-binding protein